MSCCPWTWIVYVVRIVVVDEGFWIWLLLSIWI
jgi:hypothetical protein